MGSRDNLARFWRSWWSIWGNGDASSQSWDGGERDGFVGAWAFAGKAGSDSLLRAVAWRSRLCLGNLSEGLAKNSAFLVRAEYGWKFGDQLVASAGQCIVWFARCDHRFADVANSLRASGEIHAGGQMVGGAITKSANSNSNVC